MQRQWDPQESVKILALVELHGTKWSDFSALLKRSTSSMRSHHARLLGMDKGRTSSRSNRCGACGLVKKGHICLVEPEPGEVALFERVVGVEVQP